MSIEAADALMGVFGFKRIEGEQMKTVEETRRELFEAWHRKEFPAVEVRAQNLLGTYTRQQVELSWLGFNAALDAVEVQMPSRFEYSNPDVAGAAIFDCATAIKSTGLGLTIK